MTSQEYRSIIAALGLSQASAARLLGVGAVASRRWATGARAVPGPAERFLRYLVATGADPDRVNLLIDQRRI
jgi:DNA-binding transcriptional regulator YiaG